ncbi:Uncharacterized protein Fot_36709 [Forsythia ovata]|uniref:Uncharacterized protein n=1 Tax=Forsythia ovata TaxID=205694 RepID=A0ABD1SQT6_9LAMI
MASHDSSGHPYYHPFAPPAPDLDDPQVVHPYHSPPSYSPYAPHRPPSNYNYQFIRVESDSTTWVWALPVHSPPPPAIQLQFVSTRNPPKCDAQIPDGGQESKTNT